MGEFLGCRDDYGVYFGGQPPVGIGYGAFCLEVYHIPDSADYVSDTQFSADVYGEVVVFDDSYSFESGNGLPYDFDFPFRGEMSAFVYVDADGYHDLIEHGQRTFENVEVACRERIERARE